MAISKIAGWISRHRALTLLALLALLFAVMAIPSGERFCYDPEQDVAFAPGNMDDP